MKIAIENVAQELRDQGVPPQTINEVIKGLEKTAAEEKQDRGNTPKLKTQLVCLIDDPENKFNGQPVLGWVVKIEAKIAWEVKNNPAFGR